MIAKHSNMSSGDDVATERRLIAASWNSSTVSILTCAGDCRLFAYPRVLHFMKPQSVAGNSSSLPTRDR